MIAHPNFAILQCLAGNIYSSKHIILVLKFYNEYITYNAILLYSFDILIYMLDPIYYKVTYIGQIRLMGSHIYTVFPKEYMNIQRTSQDNIRM